MMIIEKNSSAASIDAQGRANFDALSYEEKCAAICDLCDHGLSDYSIAGACRISVEQVRKVLADRRTGSELLNERFANSDAKATLASDLDVVDNVDEIEPSRRLESRAGETFPTSGKLYRTAHQAHAHVDSNIRINEKTKKNQLDDVRSNTGTSGISAASGAGSRCKAVPE